MIGEWLHIRCDRRMNASYPLVNVFPSSIINVWLSFVKSDAQIMVQSSLLLLGAYRSQGVAADISPGGKAVGAWSWPFIPSSA